MKYNTIFTIPYQELDMNRKLRLYTLEDHILTTAGMAADDQGFGTKDLLPYGYTWIITRMNLHIKYLPTHGESIRIETWIEQNTHMLSVRNYRIYLENKNTPTLIGVAKTVWAVLDMQKREIVDAFSLPMFAHAVDGEPLEIHKNPRLSPITTPDGETEHKISYSDVDYNGHCNSCKYMEIMLDTQRPEFMERAHAQKKDLNLNVDINYQKEMYLGEEMKVRYSMNEEQICYQIVNTEGTTCSNARIQKTENSEC